MKKNLIIILAVFMSTSVMANGAFERAMGESIPAIFSTDNADGLQQVINKLDRVGAAEADRWEPHYYVAFGYLRMSAMYEQLEDKDKYLNLALAAIAKGEEVAAASSELETMRGYIQMMKLNADPANRGMQYSGMVFASFQKAIGLDETNPRAHFLLGRMQYGTAQFMGGGNEEACATLGKSVELFEQQVQPENPFAPTWGKENAKGAYQEICEQ